MIDLAKASADNSKAMQRIRHAVIQETIANGDDAALPAHCRPSSEEEICRFFWLNDEAMTGGKKAVIKAN